jgi:hypothetical protein
MELCSCSHYMPSWCDVKLSQLYIFQGAAHCNMFFDVCGGQRKVNYSELIGSKMFTKFKQC